MELIQGTDCQGPKPDGTFSALGSLPRVPLPRVDKSIEAFLDWCTPLLTSDELLQTFEAAEDFARSDDAAILHKALQEYDRTDGVYSWLDDFWPARYLGRRVPVAINANFIFRYKDQPYNQVQRAARLIAAGVSYKLKLDAEEIPLAKMRDKLLCMSQQKYLFSSTRIPAKGRDIAQAPYSEERPGPSQAKHVLVCYRGHYYRLDVIDDNNNGVTLASIERTLNQLLESSPEPVADAQRAGYFTTLPRDDWADTYAQLSSNNRQALDDIEQALFCVCLEDSSPEGMQEPADQLLHGDGGNRWFDKSVSLIVFANGVAGINCEHCGLDGTVVVDFSDYLMNEEVIGQLEQQDDSGEVPELSEITFSLTDELSGKNEVAKQGFETLAANTASHWFCFEDFGAARIKTFKVSPDAFAQLGFQLAHWRTKGLIGATYESIATRFYERGRTEAMRVVTSQVIEFVNAMLDPETSQAKRRQALQAAANAHIDRIRQCQSGNAPEQHLWQLQMLAQLKGDELGTAGDFDLFQSPGWLKMRNDYLSTSSAPSDNISVFGFGATSEQCIGTAYLIRANAIQAYLSTPTPVAGQMHNFAENLHQAYRDMAAVMAEE